MKRFILMLCALFIAVPVQAQGDLNVGILAKRGAEDFYERWLPLAAYLREKTGQGFTMVPLKFDEIESAVKTRKVDFIFTNPSMFVTLQERYGVQALATMTNASAFGGESDRFGGVIFTSPKSKNIKSMKQVAGKKFYAVKKSSLGGYQMALRELSAAGLDQGRLVANTEFVGSHDKVVREVLDHPGSVGTVRTNIIERMKYEGKIPHEDFVIINRKNHKNFPFAASTRLYPEWPIAVVKGVPGAAASKLAKALFAMDKASMASQASHVSKWSRPADYAAVRQLLQELGLL